MTSSVHDALPHDWKIPGLQTHLGTSQGGKLLGVQMQPRDIAAGLYAAGFRDAQALADAVKVCLSESQGYTRAFNDNTNAAGQVTTRDVGLMEINIPAEQIGTPLEEALYDPATNFSRAFILWKHRRFEPWVAWISDVYLRDTYVKRAARGVGNWFAQTDLARVPTDTLGGAPYLHTLTSPVLDYEYRVVGMNNALLEIARLGKKHPVSVPAIETAAARGLAAAKS